MGLYTECDLVVVGPPADIGDFEATQTERTRSALLGGYTKWDRGGWPSDRVVRIGTRDLGRALYRFAVKNSYPDKWAAMQAIDWPRLDFRTHCDIEANDPDAPGNIYRFWLSAAGLTLYEALTDDEAPDHRRTGGWLRWLHEAGGITRGDLDGDEKIELIAPLLSRTLAVVRAAVVDGSLSNLQPVVIESSEPLVVGSDKANAWLNLAESGYYPGLAARIRLDLLCTLLDAARRGWDFADFAVGSR